MPDGIFCANFGQPGKGRPECHGAWCAPCYREDPLIPFSVFRAKGADGEDLEIRGEDQDRYRTARPGDILMCPFECDSCHFYKLNHRTEDPHQDGDRRIMALIRRANLDAFWAREPTTVRGNLGGVRKVLRTQDELGLSLLPPLGPWEDTYDHGMGVALCLLMDSLSPGKHEATVKHSSVRKIRSVFANIWGATALGSTSSQTWLSDYKRRTVATKAPTATEWFTCFSAGIRNRMGTRTKQDAAVSIEVMVELMNRLETRFARAIPKSGEQLEVIQAANFACLSFCAGLRGFEVPKVVLDYLREFREREPLNGLPPHFGLPLAGRFKLQGNMDQNLLLFVAAETASGLKPLLWVDRLITSLEDQGVTSGWAFQDKNGRQLKMSSFEEQIFEILGEIQEDRPDLISEKIDVMEDYGLARSFR